MGNIRLFENWTFTRPLPQPFEDEVQKLGKKYTTKDGAISSHNRMARGKRATLHAASLRAIVMLGHIVQGMEEGGAGYQKEDEKIRWYCLESVREKAGVKERRVVVYEPMQGKWKGIVHTGSVISKFPQFGEKSDSGRDILALLSYASTVEGPLYDGEFSNAFSQFTQELGGRSSMDKLMDLAFLLCDNLYRRIENAGALGNAGIPFDNGSIASGNVPLITNKRFEEGYYSPTHVDWGEFTVLKKKHLLVKGTIGALKEKYHKGLPLNDEEQALVPTLPESYDVPEEVTEILDAVVNTPMRVFMSAGESGTGKTTNAKMVAQLLGLPYYFFTCGEGTDEVDLVSSMIPNIGSRKGTLDVTFPSYEDMMMDPASALERVSGVYEDGIEPETAFQKIMDLMYQKGFEGGQKEKDFCLVESSIVTGCRRPSVIEIQEPSVITKAGTLVKLNGLLDDGAAITLTNGEVVRRNPETIILLTTNMGYKGCRGFNESVLSRMRMILYSESLTAENMVERVKKKVNCPDVFMLRQMADTVCEIQKYCRTEMITGGVCGYREYEDWVWAYLVQKDVCKAAMRTVVAKAAPEEEDREDIYKNQILTRFQTARAA